MKVKTDVVLTNLDGEPLKDADAKGEAVDATLKMCVINALLAPAQQGQKPETGVEKLKKYNLASKVNDNEEIELSAEEISLIKDRVGELFPPLVVGQVFKLLGEPTEISN